MHPSARAHMKMCIDTYLRPDRHYKVLDLGSRMSRADHSTHRQLLAAIDHEYVGVDIKPGPNVDVVMKKPYRIPLKSNSVDVAITGQVFEHIAFPWTSFYELSRVVRPGGYIFLIAPSRGHVHDVWDCWRYFPDSMRALAAITRMELRELHSDLSPTPRRRIDYGGLDPYAYWGDTVGVFRKPRKPSKLVRIAGEVNVWWANRVGGIGHVPIPAADPRRKLIVEKLSSGSKTVGEQR
jgi:SAM-dependent methyltransferase